MLNMQIIELWLSYIQPWRYTDPKQVSVDGDYPVEQWYVCSTVA